MQGRQSVGPGLTVLHSACNPADVVDLKVVLQPVSGKVWIVDVRLGYRFEGERFDKLQALNRQRPREDDNVVARLLNLPVTIGQPRIVFHGVVVRTCCTVQGVQTCDERSATVHSRRNLGIAELEVFDFRTNQFQRTAP